VCFGRNAKTSHYRLCITIDIVNTRTDRAVASFCGVRKGAAATRSAFARVQYSARSQDGAFPKHWLPIPSDIYFMFRQILVPIYLSGEFYPISNHTDRWKIRVRCWRKCFEVGNSGIFFWVGTSRLPRSRLKLARRHCDHSARNPGIKDLELDIFQTAFTIFALYILYYTAIMMSTVWAIRTSDGRGFGRIV